MLASVEFSWLHGLSCYFIIVSTPTTGSENKWLTIIWHNLTIFILTSTWTIRIYSHLLKTYANQQQQMGWVQIVMDVVMPLSVKIMSYGLMLLSKIMVAPLSKPQGGNPDVIESVPSQTPEDFNALLEMHPLIHRTLITTIETYNLTLS